jgi:isopenicillin-N epimerase
MPDRTTPPVPAPSAPHPPALPRRFGHAILGEWALDPAVLYLNHGTVGCTPRRVLAAQRAIRDEIERQPARFLLRELATDAGPPRTEPQRLRVAARVVAEFVGARGEDLAFVDNATAGANAVLRSQRFEPGDEILATDLGYGAVTHTARFAARAAGATVRVVEMPWPFDPALLPGAIAGAIGPCTRLAIVDHVCSESALVMPIAEIVSACHAKGVPVLADGAHAPGALDLDVPATGADWYVANLHKWACAPRSSGFLWARPERQAELHPPVISWGLDRGFLAEFDWVGTRDPSPFLAAPDGIAFMRDLGLDAMRAYQRGLAREGGRFLAARWGTTLDRPDSMVGAMITVPLPPRFGGTPEAAQSLRDALLFEDGIEVQMHAWRQRLWVRVSAQVYVEMADLARLADRVLARA